MISHDPTHMSPVQKPKPSPWLLDPVSSSLFLWWFAKTLTKETWGNQGLIWLIDNNTSQRTAKVQGRNLDVWTEADSMKELCLLANALAHSQLSFLYNHAQLHKHGIAYSERSLLLWISYQENTPWICIQADCMEATLFRHVKLTKNNHHRHSLPSSLKPHFTLDCSH